ncbi:MULTISPECIES: DUF1842 domain-containing protein [unclassified Janthinobacterium]|jgi:Domain of unknown function (DUF1842)|uniref:DUF1842 domain-containing protein n=1 Tax=unclassified Janthinobacterium TaxID=2610881 RepID=UPI0016130F3E|nr:MULTISPECIES: DUF1842 domain-containing protein [unclassified Janthinobacterium]MBB5606120.1 hypothetical protein [Janthinobacterium sp. S3T4]MBB5616078.1 hypothetical protein [Janthinobacterium sp. S3M3]
MATPEQNVVEHLYLTAGNLGLPGAPILNLAVLYNSADGALSGEALIAQAIAPPNGRVVIRPVSGQAHGLGLQHYTRAFTLSGEYTVSVPPPAIGTYLAKFTATFVTDNDWTGRGTFTYGDQTVKDVPIKKRG